MNNQARLDRSFLALSHPVRRTIVERLARGPASVGEATKGVGVSKPAVTKHLKLLEDAGLVHREIRGREHRLSLDASALDTASGWLEFHRHLWEAKFDAVERHLAEEDERRSSMATQQSTVLQLTRKFNAPPERVFDAWTNSELLKQWWAAQPQFEPSLAEVDVREGGRYRLGMRDTESGVEHIVGGVYREVRRPERLVYTWTWEGGAMEMEGSVETLVEVDFRDAGGATEVVVTHSGFADEKIRDLHAHGWNGCLDSLERLLS